MTLQVKHLSFARNDELLLSDIHFNLQMGELLQVAGDNGSGKSTLLRIIAGLLTPESGEILWENKANNIHYLGHLNALKLPLTVEENFRFAASLKSSVHATSLTDFIIEKNAAFAPLKKLQHRQTLQLSEGQKRRVALARLLLSDAALWILDEPTTALDHDGQVLFFNLLKKHLEEGGMAIITTHHDIPDIFSTKKILRLGAQHV